MIPGNRPEDAERERLLDELADCFPKELDFFGSSTSDQILDKLADYVEACVANASAGAYSEGIQFELERRDHIWRGGSDSPTVQWLELPDHVRADLVDWFTENQPEICNVDDPKFSAQCYFEKPGHWSPAEMFDTWLSWNGIVNWGPKILSVIAAIEKATEEQT